MSQTILASPNSLKKAATKLAQVDPILDLVIRDAGLPLFSPHNNYYESLCDAIISQQLSVKAAATIEKRFKALFGLNEFPPPALILQKTVEELRECGLSRAKAGYIRDLALAIVEKRLRFDHLDKLTNQEVVKELTAVKGIGEWTAQMFLIFCMGRLDVLATGDLGIRNGIRVMYSLKSIPTPQQVTDLSKKKNWHPYESVACWYIWHSLDNKPAVPKSY